MESVIFYRPEESKQVVPWARSLEFLDTPPSRGNPIPFGELGFDDNPSR